MSLIPKAITASILIFKQACTFEAQSAIGAEQQSRQPFDFITNITSLTH